MFKVSLFFVFCYFQVLKANNSSRKLCVRAKRNCHNDIFECGFAYANFVSSCGLIKKAMSTRSKPNGTYILPPTPYTCSKDCIKAIKTLRRTKIGEELHACDCQLDGECLIVKARVAKCQNKTKRKGPSCTMALWNCTRNPLCKFLQNKFLNDCRDMVNGVRCEKKCLKIQDRLFRSTYGKPLSSCECDGPGEAYCRAIQAHAKQLRCTPGMDGTGTPAFTYFEEDPRDDPRTIHGAFDQNDAQKPSNTANFRSASTWTLVVFIMTLYLV